MGVTLGKMLRGGRLPLLAVALALYRLRVSGPKGKSLLTSVGGLFEGSSPAARVAGDVLGVYVGAWLLRRLLAAPRDVRTLTPKRVKDVVGTQVVDALKRLPGADKKIQAEYEKMEADLDKSLKPAEREQLFELPAKGIPREQLLDKMKQMSDAEQSKWEDGWVSGAVYHGGLEHMKLQSDAFAMYSITNPLHPDVWPSVMKFEAEVVSMTANLLNGGVNTVCGTMTSGGTESILMAAKTHRKWARDELGITDPEIVAPVTAHAGIDKACDILGIKLVHVPVNPKTQAVDAKVLRRYITADTIMIYSSAPQYPHGIIDPIEELSRVAKEYGCGLHVDCCLGGFVLPFARKLGYPIPRFDFELEGVTSMSVDTHKYGYASKGTSVVLYRTPELRRHQYFTYPNWPGGLYVTPSTAGSRPGALSAACWASLVAMGEQGFLDATREIIDGAKKIKQAVKTMEGIEVVGDPIAMIVAFKSDKFNVYSVADRMHKRGWSLNSLQRPASVHICVTLRTVPVIDRFISDLRECVAEVAADPSAIDKSGNAPVYGLASAAPAGPVQDMLCLYTDVVLKV